MNKISDAFKLNLDILVECREQMSLCIDDVSKKIPKIASFENGKLIPTYKQLSDLAKLYQVPEWVFVSDNLPEKYQYSSKPAFRAFADQPLYTSKVRGLVAKLEKYRDFFLELKQEMNGNILPFKKPAIPENTILNEYARTVRLWLSIQKDEQLDFLELKRQVEEKGIFVFLTSKYKDWSYIEQDFRGLSITHKLMPIIIINNSDSKKAQSFTLMHELAHILRGDTAIDGQENTSDEEKWCDRLAGEILMPCVSQLWEGDAPQNLKALEELAKKFKVSSYACLVRLQQLKKIDFNCYTELKKEIEEKYEKIRNIQKEKKAPIPRNRSKEISEQFSGPFIRAVLTAWHNKEITLHKASHIFGLKKSKYFLELNQSHG